MTIDKRPVPEPAHDAGAVATVGQNVVRKVWDLLSPHEQRQSLFLFPAVVVMALLDTAGLASIVPFLSLLSDPNAIGKHKWLSVFYTTFHFESRESFAIWSGVLVLAVLVIGNIFAAFTTWWLLHFSWMRNHTLSLRLLSSYLNRPYSFFLTRNTAELAQRILSEVQDVVAGVIVQGMYLGARLVVVIATFAILLLIDPLIALGVGVLFGCIYGTLFLSVRRRLQATGRRRLEANRRRFKLASEMLSGIKEVKIAGLENAFLQEYAVPSEENARAWALINTYSSLPKFALETVAFGGVLFTVVFLLWRGNPLENVLPVVGLYAFAAYRLLPSLQAIFTGLTTVRGNLAALDALAIDLASVDKSDAPLSTTPPAALPFSRAVRLAEVTYRYPSGERPTLESFDVALEAGKWVAFVGPTGSGKSTLIDVLLGLLTPESGALVVDDAPIAADNVRGWQQNAGYVPQQIFLADDTIARNIALGVPKALIDHEQVKRAARIAQLADFVERESPDGYETAIGDRGVRLSGGQRQRVGIARALYRQPKLLILDEATSALDGETEQRFFTALREAYEDCTVVSIAHRLTTTRDFDAIYVLERGEIVDSGTFGELLGRNRHFASLRETGT